MSAITLQHATLDLSPRITLTAFWNHFYEYDVFITFICQSDDHIPPKCRPLAPQQSVNYARFYTHGASLTVSTDKSGKKPVPKAARRRHGAGIEPQSLSQPATPALSEVSVASSEEPPPSQLTSHHPADESQQLAEESLITHAAGGTSQTSRDEAEVQLQHRADELARERGISTIGTPNAETDLVGSQPHSTAGGSAPEISIDRSQVLGKRRTREDEIASDAPQLEQPHIQQQLLGQTSRAGEPDTQAHLIGQGARTRSASAAADTTPNELDVNDEGASPGHSTNKRKRAAGQKQSANKRARHLQTSGEITLDTIESEIQQSIEGAEEPQPQSTKKPRKIRKDKGIPRKKKQDQPQGDGQNGDTSAPTIAPASTRELRRRPVAPPQDIANREVTELEGEGEGGEEDKEHRRKRRKRKATPDGNEDIEIDPAQAQMADMLFPAKIGKLSTIEKRMREIDWAEVKRKRMAARNPPEEGDQDQEQTGKQANGEDEEAAASGTNVEEEDEDMVDSGPVRQRTRIVNGVVTVVEEALHVDRHAEGDAEMETLEVVEHEDLTERITSNSWIDANRRDPVERKCGRKKSDPWNLRDTDKFYEALRMFGTDFFVIAKMFKGKTRRQVKMKFVREEHDDPDRVKRALHGERKLLDIEAFKLATGITNFKSPEEIHRELEEDKREREEEIVRAREEYEETERQRKVLEAGGGGDNPESAKENEMPGTKGKKKAKNKGKTKGHIAAADQAEEIVEVIEE